MNNLLTAIMTKTAGSSLSTDVAGRIFEGEAPEGTEFPYVILRIVSNLPEYPGGHTIEGTLLEFSLFSISDGLTEITGMLSHLRTLFDDCTLSITGSTLIYFIRGNFAPVPSESIVTPEGTTRLRHWAQEYALETVN